MGTSKSLSDQFGSNTFRRLLEGVIPHLYLAENNRGDDGKIVNLDARRTTASSPKLSDVRTRQIRNRKPSPTETLRDLCLPLDRFEHLIDLLGQVGYKFGEEEIKVNYSERRKYNYVKQENAPKQQENTRYLIYIPKKIFDKQENSELIKAIYYDFSISKPLDSFIIVFSDLKKLPDLRFREIIEQKSNQSFKRSYVPWEDIQKLDSNNPTQKKDVLASILILPPFL